MMAHVPLLKQHSLVLLADNLITNSLLPLFMYASTCNSLNAIFSFSCLFRGCFVEAASLKYIPVYTSELLIPRAYYYLQ